MKILIVNGSPHKNDSMGSALARLAQEIKFLYKESADVDKFDLAAKKISIGHCGYCGKCKSISGGECIFNNAASVFIRKIYMADSVIIGTPIYQWGISSQLEAAIKKLFSEAVELEKRRRTLLFLAQNTDAQNDRTVAGLQNYFRFISEHLKWDYLGCEVIPAQAESGSNQTVGTVLDKLHPQPRAERHYALA